MNDDLGSDDPGTLLDGFHRVCSAETTLARVLPLKHQFGITRVANVTGLDRIGLPVVLAVRPMARSIAISQGKGPTLAAAQASAVMEAVEIWHAEHLDAPVHFARAADLEGRHAVVDLERLPQTPQGRVSATERVLWVPAVELLNDCPILVPHEMVHADYTHPVPPGTGLFPASTNGLASGNHPLEAICHGICEVIERDALAVWHRLPLVDQNASRLDLSSVPDGLAAGAIGKFLEAGFDCAVWDITTDIGVASFLCVINDEATGDGHLGLGSGTHPDRDIALLRALTEAAQTRLNYISGAREDLAFDEFSDGGRAEKTEAFADLLAMPGNPRPYDQVPTQVNRDLQSDLDWLKAQLQSASIEQIAVVDLTREEFGIPVTRIIIPGLEAPHDDDNYVPGQRAGGGGA